MNATRLYTSSGGQSLFEDFDIPLTDAGDIGQLSKQFPVKNLIFRKTSENYDYQWHTAPERQFVIMLDGAVEITASSGEKRVFDTGDILLLEDTHGQGHMSKSVNHQIRKSIFITLHDSQKYNMAE